MEWKKGNNGGEADDNGNVDNDFGDMVANLAMMEVVVGDTCVIVGIASWLVTHVVCTLSRSNKLH